MLKPSIGDIVVAVLLSGLVYWLFGRAAMALFWTVFALAVAAVNYVHEPGALDANDLPRGDDRV